MRLSTNDGPIFHGFVELLPHVISKEITYDSSTKAGIRVSISSMINRLISLRTENNDNHRNELKEIISLFGNCTERVNSIEESQKVIFTKILLDAAVCTKFLLSNITFLFPNLVSFYISFQRVAEPLRALVSSLHEWRFNSHPSPISGSTAHAPSDLPPTSSLVAAGSAIMFCGYYQFLFGGYHIQQAINAVKERLDSDGGSSNVAAPFYPAVSKEIYEALKQAKLTHCWWVMFNNRSAESPLCMTKATLDRFLSFQKMFALLHGQIMDVNANLVLRTRKSIHSLDLKSIDEIVSRGFALPAISQFLDNIAMGAENGDIPIDGADLKYGEFPKERIGGSNADTKLTTSTLSEEETERTTATSDESKRCAKLARQLIKVYIEESLRDTTWLDDMNDQFWDFLNGFALSSIEEKDKEYPEMLRSVYSPLVEPVATFVSTSEEDNEMRKKTMEMEMSPFVVLDKCIVEEERLQSQGNRGRPLNNQRKPKSMSGNASESGAQETTTGVYSINSNLDPNKQKDSFGKESFGSGLIDVNTEDIHARGLAMLLIGVKKFLDTPYGIPPKTHHAGLQENGTKSTSRKPPSEGDEFFPSYNPRYSRPCVTEPSYVVHALDGFLSSRKAGESTPYKDFIPLLTILGLKPFTLLELLEEWRIQKTSSKDNDSQKDGSRPSMLSNRKFWAARKKGPRQALGSSTVKKRHPFTLESSDQCYAFEIDADSGFQELMECDLRSESSYSSGFDASFKKVFSNMQVNGRSWDSLPASEKALALLSLYPNGSRIAHILVAYVRLHLTSIFQMNLRAWVVDIHDAALSVLSSIDIQVLREPLIQLLQSISNSLPMPSLEKSIVCEKWDGYVNPAVNNADSHDPITQNSSSKREIVIGNNTYYLPSVQPTSVEPDEEGFPTLNSLIFHRSPYLALELMQSKESLEARKNTKAPAPPSRKPYWLKLKRLEALERTQDAQSGMTHPVTSSGTIAERLSGLPEEIGTAVSSLAKLGTSLVEDDPAPPPLQLASQQQVTATMASETNQTSMTEMHSHGVETPQDINATLDILKRVNTPPSPSEITDDLLSASSKRRRMASLPSRSATPEFQNDAENPIYHSLHDVAISRLDAISESSQKNSWNIASTQDSNVDIGAKSYTDSHLDFHKSLSSTTAPDSLTNSSNLSEPLVPHAQPPDFFARNARDPSAMRNFPHMYSDMQQNYGYGGPMHPHASLTVPHSMLSDISMRNGPTIGPHSAPDTFSSPGHAFNIQDHSYDRSLWNMHVQSGQLIRQDTVAFPIQPSYFPPYMYFPRQSAHRDYSEIAKPEFPPAFYSDDRDKHRDPMGYSVPPETPAMYYSASYVPYDAQSTQSNPNAYQSNIVPQYGYLHPKDSVTHTMMGYASNNTNFGTDLDHNIMPPASSGLLCVSGFNPCVYHSNGIPNMSHSADNSSHMPNAMHFPPMNQGQNIPLPQHGMHLMSQQSHLAPQQQQSPQPPMHPLHPMQNHSFLTNPMQSSHIPISQQMDPPLPLNPIINGPMLSQSTTGMYSNPSILNPTALLHSQDFGAFSEANLSSQLGVPGLTPHQFPNRLFYCRGIRRIGPLHSLDSSIQYVEAPVIKFLTKREENYALDFTKVNTACYRTALNQIQEVLSNARISRIPWEPEEEQKLLTEAANAMNVANPLKQLAALSPIPYEGIWTRGIWALWGRTYNDLMEKWVSLPFENM